MERKTEVRTYRTEQFCSCGGKMKYTGGMLASNPPWYIHKCEDCGENKNFREVYPKIAYEPVLNPSGKLGGF